MKDSINSFKGKYSFLSNFYGSLITYGGRKYAAVEDAFQAAKTLDESDRFNISIMASAAEAKKYGRTVKLREDWEVIKVGVMKDLLRQKFSHPKLRKLLLETGDAHLEEGNHHGDRFWGTVNGVGNNMLGKLLMEVRDEIRTERA